MQTEIRAQLNAGDEIMWCGRGAPSFAKVERVTNTQAILPNGVKLKRAIGHDGHLHEISAERWSCLSYSLPTAAGRAAHHLARLRAAVQRKVEALGAETNAANDARLSEIMVALNSLIKP